MTKMKRMDIYSELLGPGALILFGSRCLEHVL